MRVEATERMIKKIDREREFKKKKKNVSIEIRLTGK